MTPVIAGSINAPQAHKSNPYSSAPKVRYVHLLDTINIFKYQIIN